MNVKDWRVFSTKFSRVSTKHFIWIFKDGQHDKFGIRTTKHYDKRKKGIVPENFPGRGVNICGSYLRTT